jgi:hypothetical protein
MRHAIFIASVVVLLSATTASARLTHRYSFNDGTARDSVGGADGVLVNGPTVENGVLVFSRTTNNGFNTSPATGQYVDLPNDIARTPAFTLEFWTTYRGGGAWQRVVDFGNNDAGKEVQPTDRATGYFGKGFIFFSPDNGQGTPIAQISVDSWGGPTDTEALFGRTALPPGVEQHIVFRHAPDQSSTLGTGDRLYINGVEVGGANYHDTSAMHYVNYWLGRSQFSQDPNYNGTINEFRIYDHGLTPEEVRADYASGPNAVPEPTAPALAVIAAATLLRRRRGNVRW